MVRHDQYRQGLRIAALEARDASPATGLSGQRLEYIFRCAHQFQQRHGARIDETLAGLAAHFRVENIYYLPERDWPAVLEWFESLLEEW